MDLADIEELEATTLGQAMASFTRLAKVYDSLDA